MPDLDALLRRIGLDAPPPPTLDGLDTLHRAFASRVPFEDLAIHLGETEPLDLDRVAERILHGGRGGYCFELNGILAWMLEHLGFEVERREAVVGPRGDNGATNHLALVVRPPGEAPRIAEVGFGHGPMQSVPLAPGPHPAADAPLAWTLFPEPDGRWYWAAHRFSAAPGIAIGARSVPYAAFAPHHERVATAPDSMFVQTLVVQRPGDDRLRSLRARTFTITGPRDDQRHVLADAGELATVLRDEFGIDPDALGPARIARLWEAAADQHETWLREREAGAA